MGLQLITTMAAAFPGIAALFAMAISYGSCTRDAGGCPALALGRFGSGTDSFTVPAPASHASVAPSANAWAAVGACRRPG